MAHNSEQDYSWKPWSKVKDALNETVLVMFLQSDGNIHIEDCTIAWDDDEDNVYYYLFDGHSFGKGTKPLYWMLIPDAGLPNGIFQSDAGLKTTKMTD